MSILDNSTSSFSRIGKSATVPTARGMDPVSSRIVEPSGGVYTTPRNIVDLKIPLPNTVGTHSRKDQVRYRKHLWDRFDAPLAI